MFVLHMEYYWGGEVQTFFSEQISIRGCLTDSQEFPLYKHFKILFYIQVVAIFVSFIRFLGNVSVKIY